MLHKNNILLLEKCKRLASFLIHHTLPFHNKRIVFSSWGKICDNPKSIYEYLEDNYPGQFQYVWFFKDTRAPHPSNVKVVKKTVWNVLYYFSSSAIWISNSGVMTSLYKSRKQLYIETWHGDRGFKKIRCDVEGVDKELNNMDLVLSGSTYFDKVIRSAFRYNGEILQVGCPRNDRFFNSDKGKIKEIRERIGISEEKRVLLFAPTFRDNDVLSRSKQDVEIDLDTVITTLNTYTTDEWIVLTRAHHNVSKAGLNVTSSNTIIDVTSYPDMNELLLLTDILVTDYSSSAGDFILYNKLILLFQPDRGAYGKERDFYFDLNNSPYYSATTADEFYNLLKEVPKYDVTKNCSDLRIFYGTYEDGHACEKTVDRILSFVNQNQK